MSNKPDYLTAKQNTFINEYLIDLNAAGAARRAGYSVKHADVIGYELLGKTLVSEAIRKRIEMRAEKLEITSERILNELAKVAFSNIYNVLDFDNGRFVLKKIAGLNDYAGVKSISYNNTGFSVQLGDKVSALKMLGDYFNLWSGEANKKNNCEDRASSTARVLEIIKNRIERVKVDKIS